MSYDYLPGMQVITVDGGLTSRSAPVAKKTIAVGTATKGPGGTPYLVTDRSVAAQLFGLQGTLIQTMEELAQAGCDNIYLYRMGTQQAKLSGIGAVYDSQGVPLDLNNIGFTVTFGQVQPNLTSVYQVYYDGAGILQLFLNGNQIYSNDPSNPIDTLDSTVTGMAVGGVAIESSTALPGASAWAKSLPLSNSLISASMPLVVPDVGGAITSITIVPGTGEAYVNQPTCVITGTGVNGTGFQGDVQMDGSGNLTSVNIILGGQGFTGPVAVTFTGGNNSIDANASAVVSPIIPGTIKPALLLYLGDSGMSYNQTANPCSVYEKMMLAFDVLDMVPCDQVVVPNCWFDTPNVAFYSTILLASSIHNPDNGTALGWLKTWRDSANTLQFQWAHLTVDSTGATVTPPVFTSAGDRILQGYHEVSFGFALARFCAKQSSAVGGCLGFIGTTPPKNYQPGGLATWIGQVATLDSNGNVAVAGVGLLGNPYLRGTSASALNPLCADIQTKVYRIPGLYQTVSTNDPEEFGEYDEPVLLDANGYQTEMGGYIHVCSGWGLLTNGVSTGYKNNISCVVAGLTSAMDEKSALTNKVLPGVSQIYRLPSRILNKLVYAKLNELRYKGDTVPAVLLHDRTAANDASDYVLVLTQRIKFMVEEDLYSVIDPYIGETSTDGLSMAAMQTAIDSRMLLRQKQGYITGYKYNVSTSIADRRVGRIFLNITFIPVNELIQVRTSITAGQS